MSSCHKDCTILSENAGPRPQRHEADFAEFNQSLALKPMILFFKLWTIITSQIAEKLSGVQRIRTLWDVRYL